MMALYFIILLKHLLVIEHFAPCTGHDVGVVPSPDGDGWIKSMNPHLFHRKHCSKWTRALGKDPTLRQRFLYTRDFLFEHTQRTGAVNKFKWPRFRMTEEQCIKVAYNTTVRFGEQLLRL